MFTKVLIANRGEIAVRIIRACRELGLLTVAVYSEADRSALHVRLADEAYLLGPAPARDSYLRGDKIIDLARACGAGAIHPGYGFLAERDDFARQVEQAGLAFIGPRPSAIAAMGDKATARATVAAAGVLVVPGTEGEGSLRDEEILAVAPSIGFPLLVKATAGGGGKGMREVNRLEDLPGLLHAARREAESAFGDGNVYLEKLLTDARHIEFQILADSQGGVIHLGDASARCSGGTRSCSRSPSPFLDDDLRQRMGEVACKPPRRRLHQRRDDRVPGRPRTQLLLPGDEHPPSGRAPGDGDGHRRRHRQGAIPHRPRAQAALHPGRHPPQRLGARVPGQCRGRLQQLPAIHRHADHDHTAHGPGRARRHRRLPGVRDLALLRLADLQIDLLGRDAR
jgi:hypothetical protein